MKCTQCGAEIKAWIVDELWSGERRELLNDDERQLCNSCAWGCDGIINYIELPRPPSPTFIEFLDTIPGIKRFDDFDGIHIFDDKGEGE